jgi:hypothetical protein
MTRTADRTENIDQLVNQCQGGPEAIVDPPDQRDSSDGSSVLNAGT